MNVPTPTPLHPQVRQRIIRALGRGLSAHEVHREMPSVSLAHILKLVQEHRPSGEQRIRERLSKTVRHLPPDELAAYQAQLLARDAANFRRPDNAPLVYAPRRKVRRR